MPSSADRKRLEVPTNLYDRLVEIAIDEDRTVASVVQEVMHTGLQHYAPGINAERDFARYTERARCVLAFAREETVPFNHNYIGTEHVLLGLLRVEDGVAARALTMAGVEYEQCRAFVEQHIGQGSGSVPAPMDLPYMPRVRAALRFAEQEADRFGSHTIGTEHLLLGLLRVSDGLAARMLSLFGVSNAVHTETLRAMTHYEPIAAPPTQPKERGDGHPFAM